MEVTIPAGFESFVGEQVASGAFDSPGALVAASLKVFQSQLHPLATAEAQTSIMESYRQAKAGEFSNRSLDDIKREARAKFEAEQRESA
tara:strand:- start:5696 stop:5962 length:267 start_codon:yes stop_codon:yes gene_type:complete